MLFWMILLVQRSVRSENGDMLDFDDPLNEFAMFLRARGLQQEVEIVQKNRTKKQKGIKRAFWRLWGLPELARLLKVIIS